MYGVSLVTMTTNVAYYTIVMSTASNEGTARLGCSKGVKYRSY